MGPVEKIIGKAIIMVGKKLSQHFSQNNNFGDHRPPSCGAAMLVRK